MQITGRFIAALYVFSVCCKGHRQPHTARRFLSCYLMIVAGMAVLGSAGRLNLDCDRHFAAIKNHVDLKVVACMKVTFDAT